jgi:hypothetical protein
MLISYLPLPKRYHRKNRDGRREGKRVFSEPTNISYAKWLRNRPV